MSKPCQLCGSTQHETVSDFDRHDKPLKTVICMGCGIITNEPIPTDAELAAFYRTDYRKDYKGAAEPRMRQVWRNFRRLEKHLTDNRDIYEGHRKCLDLGSGSGEFMFLAGKLGIGCTGVEPNVDYSAYCRDKLGLNVMTQTLEEARFADGSYDLIRLSHVLEHMRQPVRSLKLLHRWLSDDGVLYIEVPDIERDAELKMRGHIFHFGHIFNFNPVTLRLAAGMAGFEELPVSRTRLGSTTGGFFGKAKTPFVMPADLKDNAQRLKVAMDAHNSRTIPKPKQGTALGRLFSTVGLRLKEIMAARRFSTHRDIAEHFGSRI